VLFEKNYYDKLFSTAMRYLHNFAARHCRISALFLDHRRWPTVFEFPYQTFKWVMMLMR